MTTTPAALGLLLALLPATGPSRPRRAPKPTPAPTLVPAAQPAAREGLAALENGDWTSAIAAFSRAQERDPLFAPTLFDLACAHDRAGHELAALAWFRAYLSAAPDAKDAGPVRERLRRLRAKVEHDVRLVAAEAARLQDELKAEGLAPRGVRDHVALVVETSARSGDWVAADAAIQALQDVTDRDGVWREVVSALAVWPDDRVAARQAAGRIADAVPRRDALDGIAQLETAEAHVHRLAGTTGEWIELARRLQSARDVVDVGGQVREAGEADVTRAPLRLMRLAHALAAAYWRIETLERKQAGGVGTTFR